MKIIRQITIAGFPLIRYCLAKAVALSDVYMCVDAAKITETEVDHLMWDAIRVYGGRIKKVEFCNSKYSHADRQWMEFRLRMLDDVKPDVVLICCEDGVFEDSIIEELKLFWKSDKLCMMGHIASPMVTNDGRVPIGGRPHPPGRHMIAFKWKQGLTYLPYQGYGRLYDYADAGCHWMAETCIKRYCMFTKSMEEEKIEQIKRLWTGHPEIFEGWPEELKP